WLHRQTIQNYAHARRLVFEYIEAFYNTVRSHSHCSYLSPMQWLWQNTTGTRKTLPNVQLEDG
ncbi:MAG: IS3 family transposase, partial [Bacillota bacterium]|nr:IS3 family transposase [Bacillota bacterium]